MLGRKGSWVPMLVFFVALSQTGKLVCTVVFPNEKDTVCLANISIPEYKETSDRGAIHRESVIAPLGRQLTSGFTGKSKADVIT